MKRILFSTILIISLVFALASCNKAFIEISDDGYIVVNGEKTEIKAQGEKGDKGDTGPQGEQGLQGEQGPEGEQGLQGLSAYEIFLKYYPNYASDEKQWIDDVAKGNVCNLFGHDCETDMVEPTCKEQGYTVYDCKVCDYVENKEYTPIAEHSFYNGVCKWCGYHEALEEAEYITTQDGWVIAVSGEQAFLMTYNGDGREMIFPSRYNDIALNFDYFSFDYKQVKSTLETLFICDEYKCEIGALAFSGFDNLTYVCLGNGVTSVGMSAFNSCFNLKTISIGAGLKYLGNTAFGNCTTLEEIYYNAVRLETVDGSPAAPFLCAGMYSEGITLHISDDVELLSHSLFSSFVTMNDSAPKITKIIISNNSKLESIGGYCFRECIYLNEIFIPQSVKSIDANAFANCAINTIFYGGDFNSWEQINIEDGNESIHNADVYYYSFTAPEAEGNYWYYDENGQITIWE